MQSLEKQEWVCFNFSQTLREESMKHSELDQSSPKGIMYVFIFE